MEALPLCAQRSGGRTIRATPSAPGMDLAGVAREGVPAGLDRVRIDISATMRVGPPADRGAGDPDSFAVPHSGKRCDP